MPKNLWQFGIVDMDIGCGCEKTNTLLNLTNQEPDIDKIYLDAKDSYEAKYKLLINKNDCISFQSICWILKCPWWYLQKN